MPSQAVPAPANSPTPALKRTLAAVVGAEHVRDDDASLLLHSEDIWEAGAHSAMLIVAPGSTTELVEVMRTAPASPSRRVVLG